LGTRAIVLSSLASFAALGPVAAAPGGASRGTDPERLYFEGRDALRAGRDRDALTLFEKALGQPMGPELRATVLRGLGHAAGKVIDADRDLACDSTAAYDSWLDLAAADDPDRPAVEEAKGRMHTLCGGASASGSVDDVTRAPPIGPVATWALTGAAAGALIAGAVFTGLAHGAQSDHQQARSDVRDERDANRQAALTDEIAQLDGDVTTFQTASVGLYVAGGLLAAAATWAWWTRVDTAVEVAFDHERASGIISVGGVW